MLGFRCGGVVLAIVFLGPPALLHADQGCAPEVARLVSVEGQVDVFHAGRSVEVTIKDIPESLCEGDQVRVKELGRAAVRLLRDKTVLRLDAQTQLTFKRSTPDRPTLLDLLRGALYFFTRKPIKLDVETPYVTAGVEGTEFSVRVDATQTRITVFEGRVLARNRTGRLTLNSGQSALAEKGRAPQRLEITPHETVRWALYYPPIIDDRWAQKQAEKEALAHYREGDLASAIAGLDRVPQGQRGVRYFDLRAGLLLSVGRIDRALADIGEALRIDPNDAQAYALKAVIHVAQGASGKALELAKKARALDPSSPVAAIALSYARQALFDIEGARDSAQQAVDLAPSNALAWARLAELELSLGRLNDALEHAEKAKSLAPRLERTQTVLGFAQLIRIRPKEAQQAFETAIRYDPAAPLPRLGLGLALIRQGRLDDGVKELEIATALDPGDALVRSYLGKAYYEQRRHRDAKTEFARARELDPHDPTPWFYDAIRALADNEPVTALDDLQESIALNDNRAVYRSRLYLDEDRAVRSASQGQVYNELGFTQLPLLEAARSLALEPGNYSAHRLLADAYLQRPRHEIARVSELLQSQLRQPLLINPAQARLAESRLGVFSEIGPVDPAFNEFTRLFSRDGAGLFASGVVGGHGTLGDEAILSGLSGPLSFSLTQFHSETDGFREDNDRNQDFLSAFAQVSLSPATSLQAEYRRLDDDRGELFLGFDPEDFFDDRIKEDTDSYRIGARHVFSPGWDVIASFRHESANFRLDSSDGTFAQRTDESGDQGELQTAWRTRWVRLIAGAGLFDANRKDSETFLGDTIAFDSDPRHRNAYLYSHWPLGSRVTATLGASYEDVKGITDRERFNPKLALAWDLPMGPVAATLRLAYFETLKRALLANQTLEPTSLAGFNQFFDDPEATRTRVAGLGLDLHAPNLYGRPYVGVEVSRRRLNVPIEVLDFDLVEKVSVDKEDIGEDRVLAYLYWTPTSRTSLGLEYEHEKFDRSLDFTGPEQIVDVDTDRIRFMLGYHHRSGLRAALRPQWIHQDGEFVDRFDDPFSGEDRFWVLDASLGYRLPRHYGLITLGVSNAFDKAFRFQDTDPFETRIAPERTIFLRGTFNLSL